MQSLDGISVLVTRPVNQAESLARAIEKQGGVAIRAPMLIVAALADRSAANLAIAQLAEFDSAIFISRNAVDFGLDLISAQKQSLKGLAVFAVGLGTAASLSALGVKAVQAPSNEFSSEGLLRLDGLSESKVKDKRIVIFRGRGGREHLAKTLQRHGAEVVYCECYERRKPEINLTGTLKKSGIKVPDIGLATSMEALENLVEKIEAESMDRLFDMQMLVVGSRVGREVESLGFTQQPMVVENPSDESILKRLANWAGDEE